MQNTSTMFKLHWKIPIIGNTFWHHLIIMMHGKEDPSNKNTPHNQYLAIMFLPWTSIFLNGRFDSCGIIIMIMETFVNWNRSFCNSWLFQQMPSITERTPCWTFVKHLLWQNPVHPQKLMSTILYTNYKNMIIIHPLNPFPSQWFSRANYLLLNNICHYWINTSSAE